MSRPQIRNRILLILVLLAGIIVALCFSAWLTASVGAAAIVLYVVLNHRLAKLMWKVGLAGSAMGQRRYADAEAALREALVLAEATGIYGWVRYDLYGHLCNVTRMQGNYTDAEQFGKLALESAEKANGPDDADTLWARADLARVYLDIARFHLALPLLEDALRAHTVQPGSDRIGHASCLEMLSELWAQQKHFAQAEIFLRQADALTRQNYPDGLPAPFAISLKLARACAEQGKLADAEALIAASLEAQASDAQRSFAMHQLAFVRYRQDRYTDAEEMARAALALCRNNAAPGGSELARHLELLGATVGKQGRWQEAELHCREAVRVREGTLAPEHPYLADSLAQLAEVLTRLGRLDEAHSYTHRAEEIRSFQAGTHQCKQAASNTGPSTHTRL